MAVALGINLRGRQVPEQDALRSFDSFTPRDHAGRQGLKNRIHFNTKLLQSLKESAATRLPEGNSHRIQPEKSQAPCPESGFPSGPVEQSVLNVLENLSEEHLSGLRAV